MMLKYYKTDGGVIATVGTLNFPEITKEEFDAAMKRVQEEADKVPAKPTPTAAELQAQINELQKALLNI